MQQALKISAIGNSLGVILPKELLAKLRVSKGDQLYAVETPDGVELRAYSAEFVAQMEIAEDILRKDRDALRALVSIMIMAVSSEPI